MTVRFRKEEQQQQSEYGSFLDIMNIIQDPPVRSCSFLLKLGGGRVNFAICSAVQNLHWSHRPHDTVLTLRLLGNYYILSITGTVSSKERLVVHSHTNPQGQHRGICGIWLS